MKVYIGNYRHHWLSPYTILEKVLFWKDWDNIDYDEPWVQKWSDRLMPFSTAWQSFLDFVHPHINYVKIDKYDTWSMDHTLSYMILPMLKQLQSTKHGAPHVDDEDVPEELRSTSAPAKENEYDVDTNHFKRWDWVLGEMIQAFECKVNDNWEEQYSSGVFDHIKVESDRTYPNPETGVEERLWQFKEGPNHTYKTDWVALRAHQLRNTNGYRLFGKYYEGLWD
jgi:hypothetical protein